MNASGDMPRPRSHGCRRRIALSVMSATVSPALAHDRGRGREHLAHARAPPRGPSERMTDIAALIEPSRMAVSAVSSLSKTRPCR